MEEIKLKDKELSLLELNSVISYYMYLNTDLSVYFLLIYCKHLLTKTRSTGRMLHISFVA